MFPQVERKLVESIESLSVNSVDSSAGVEHGESDIRVLCHQFQLSFQEVRIEYRLYKDSCGKDIGVNLRKLMNCVSTIPVSTAEGYFDVIFDLIFNEQ